MEYYIYNDDEASPLKEGNPYTPEWPFRMLIAGSSGSGKTNMLINLLLGDKLVKTYHNQEGGKRYISCNDVVLIGKHLDKPKWKNVRNFYKLLAQDSTSNFEDVTFTSYSPNEIPDVSEFSADRSTIVVFEDLLKESKNIQNQIESYFIRGRHANISPVYVTQRFYAAPKMIRENLTHITLHKGGGGLKDVKRIVSEFTDHADIVAQKIHKKLSNKEFVVFDLQRSSSDPLAIRHRWDLPLLDFADYGT